MWLANLLISSAKHADRHEGTKALLWRGALADRVDNAVGRAEVPLIGNYSTTFAHLYFPECEARARHRRRPVRPVRRRRRRDGGEDGRPLGQAPL